MAIEPKVLNQSNYSYGPKEATNAWQDNLKLLFGGGGFTSLNEKLDLGAYDSLINSAKNSMDNFKTTKNLENMNEGDLARFYMVGVSYFKLGQIDNAIGCFHVVFSQYGFKKHMLKGPVDFSNYPDLAGNYLMEIAESHGDDIVNNYDVESFLENVIGKGKKSGCFIATCVYGSYSAPEVKILKNFRDQVLLKNHAGQLFVNLYYAISPKIVAFIDNKQKIKSILKNAIIDPLVIYLKKDGKY